jgi:hypothetical protein
MRRALSPHIPAIRSLGEHKAQFRRPFGSGHWGLSVEPAELCLPEAHNRTTCSLGARMAGKPAASRPLQSSAGPRGRSDGRFAAQPMCCSALCAR